MACNGLKRGAFHFFFRHPKWSRIILEKNIFDPFLTHFLSQNSPFSRDFGIRRAKTGHHELKTRRKHLFCHSMWSRIIFEKCHFFAPGGPC